MHVDRKEAHIVSAILNVAQDVATDWRCSSMISWAAANAVLLNRESCCFTNPPG
jgi:hypothetical protein